VVYAALQLALLVLCSTIPTERTRLSIPSAALNFLVSLFLAVLSHLEHIKSIRPSFLISFYLLGSLFLDITRARTQWLLQGHSHDSIAAILTASVGVKGVVLAFEAVSKRRILLAAWRDISPENTSGVFSRGLFWWLNELLVSGFKGVLSVDDLFEINEKLGAERLGEDLQVRWENCKCYKFNTISHTLTTLLGDQKRKHALALETLWSLRKDVMVIVLPRLFLVALSVAQPFLINEAVRFIQATEIVASNNIGYGLIGGFAFVYIGSAVS